MMPRNCRRLKPPAKRLAEDSAVPIPIMVASLAQVTVECGAPNLGSGTKPSLGGTTSTASRRRGWLWASLTGTMAAGAAGLDGDVPSVVVKYSEQSLATDEGVYALYRRITNAAKQVCPAEETRDLKRQSLIKECRNQAVARAIRQIDNSRLAALHAAHSKNG